MGAGSTKPGELGQRTVHTFESSRSSNGEPTESSLGADTPPPQRRSPPTRRKPTANGGAAAAAAKRGAASSSRRSAAASGGHSSGGPGPDTRAASAAELNNQLDELDATFTSLGIVGRQLGGAGGGSSASSPSSLQSSQTSCQLQEQLQDGQQHPLQQSSGSTGSRASRERRRTQPFSWEERSASQQDNWNYQKVSLDGFDPEKFKKANKGAGYEDIRLTGDFGTRGANIAVPEYDHQDQQILASIERDFDKLIPL